MSNLINTGLIGATSFVGESLIPILIKDNRKVFSFSRKNPNLPDVSKIEEWISVAPIAALPQYFSMFERYGIKKIVVLSSTSRFTKTNSYDPAEQAIAKNLIEGEERLEKWANSKGVEWVILRPTLIYGLGKDKNIVEIVRFIKRFKFFPIFGKASGLRQPIHVDDVAGACLAALNSNVAKKHAYNISGNEVLTYKEMVRRLFIGLGYKPIFIPIPLTLFKIGVWFLHFIPRYKLWSSAMAERMSFDLVFDHSEAKSDFAFSNRAFNVKPVDLI